jgi:hypothetical protein
MRRAFKGAGQFGAQTTGERVHRDTHSLSTAEEPDCLLTCRPTWLASCASSLEPRRLLVTSNRGQVTVF